jgi:acyl-homoserine-lactone acylase
MVSRSLLVLSLCLLIGCPAGGDDDDSTAPPESLGPFAAQIRWTSWGVPHIVAEDWGSLAFGMAHAHARDHACTLADQILMVRSERARWFGRGANDANVDSDFGWLALGVREQAEAGFPTLDDQLRDALVGYAAGFRAYLEEVGRDGLPTPCRGAEWVQPFDHIDLLSYYLSLGLSGSGAVFVDAIAQAQPPDGSRSPRYGNDMADAEAMAAFRAMMEPVREPSLGSNGWGIGADDSSTGQGLLLSNTHFPYEGNRRWWESQLTIPGVVNVYGSSLVGVTAVNIGFNEDVAWTHTVSGTPRFTGYLLELEPGNPTRYLVDGQAEDMEARTYSITVPGFGGDLVQESRTLYRSRFGPVINAPIVGWTEQVAFTFRDANDNNLAMLPTWFGMNVATDLDSFVAAHREENGIPWVHTMYADAAGRAFYTDSASAPNLSPEAWAGYQEFLGDNTFAALFRDNGAILLPGGDPIYEWVDAPGARSPGLVPFADAPQLERGDYVANANNNHWLTHAGTPLEGYPPIFGDERTSRSPRTRQNLRFLENIGGAAGEDGLWTLQELEDAALSGRTSMAELLAPELSARCAALAPEVRAAYPVDGGSVDLGPACAALAGWDGAVDLDGTGAAVWREFLGGGAFSRDDLWGDTGALFAVGFDADDPLATPNTLAAAPLEVADPLLVALAEAIAISDHGDGGDDTLLPREPRGEVVNATTDLTVDGYQVNRGNSWILVVQFVDGAPQARAVMTYSQSQDEDRGSFDDQSAQVYAEGRLRDVLFTEEQIAADPNLIVEDVSWP